MASALYLRETLELSDATEQRLLRFAQGRGLKSGDTLVVAARTISGVPNYVLDLTVPDDRSYLLNLVLVADSVSAPGLSIELSGTPATTTGSGGQAGRSAIVFARDLRQPIVVRTNGGDGSPGSTGSPGADETFVIDFDERGKPHREYDPATPGQPGGNGGAGGSGGTARVVWSVGVPPQVSATGGAGGAGGKGGAGGNGALSPQGQRRPGAAGGQDGQSCANGLSGTAASEQHSVDEFWARARAELAEDLATSAAHWLAVAEYRYRRVKGTPTETEADTILGLLDLASSASAELHDAPALKAQFLAGENALGLPRNIDVVPDFERYVRRLELYGGWVDGLFNDAKNLLATTTSLDLTDAQLGVHLNTLDFTANVLQAERADAAAAVAVAEAEERGAAARWSAAVSAVDRQRAELERPIDWGGVVVVGMFSIASLIISAYVGQTAGKLIGSIPDLMTLGNVNFSGSDKETKILKDAVVAGGKLSAVRLSGAKDAAGHQTADGRIDVDSWAAESSGVLISFAKFVKDIDEASGDQALKQVLKDLAIRLQERMAAKARLESARRQLELATMRIAAVAKERALYAALHARARDDVSVLKQTALTLLSIARKHGDVFLDYQVRAARSVEIYTLQDQSESMAVDRWHVHPDTGRDFEEGFIDAAVFQSRLLASTSELAIGSLVTSFDTYDMSSFLPDVHYVSIDDSATIQRFRETRTLSIGVLPAEIAGERWQAKVIATIVTLHGVTAATPTFALAVTHGGRCTDRLQDETEVTQLLQPRSTLVQVAAGRGGSSSLAVGAVAGPPKDERPTEFWRRSIATEWTLSIEDGVWQQRQVDLSGLTRIDVGMSYVALTTTK